MPPTNRDENSAPMPSAAIRAYTSFWLNVMPSGESFSSARGGRYEVVPDLDVNGNARPDGKLSVPSDAEAYFSLDPNVMSVASLYI